MESNLGFNPYLITKRMSNSLLAEVIENHNDEFAGTLVRHVKTGGCYRISHFSVLSHNNSAEMAVNYHPFDEDSKRDLTSVRHTRPCIEFFDGRFAFDQ